MVSNAAGVFGTIGGINCTKIIPTHQKSSYVSLHYVLPVNLSGKILFVHVAMHVIWYIEYFICFMNILELGTFTKCEYMFAELEY